MRAAVERGVAELGRLDVVVANAGMTTPARAWEIPLENWDATIGINLTGAYYTARAAIPILIEQGAGGAIVFTSSVAGLVGLPLLADYVAAKHGVTGLAKTLANELGQYRIRVNSVHPFGVNTDLKPGLRELIDRDPELGSALHGHPARPGQRARGHRRRRRLARLRRGQARHRHPAPGRPRPDQPVSGSPGPLHAKAFILAKDNRRIRARILRDHRSPRPRSR